MLNALWMVDELVWHRSVSHCVLRPFCIRVLCNVRHDCHVIARCGVTCIVGSSRRERGEHIATISLCRRTLSSGFGTGADKFSKVGASARDLAISAFTRAWSSRFFFP